MSFLNNPSSETTKVYIVICERTEEYGRMGSYKSIEGLYWSEKEAKSIARIEMGLSPKSSPVLKEKKIKLGESKEQERESNSENDSDVESEEEDDESEEEEEDSEINSDGEWGLSDEDGSGGTTKYYVVEKEIENPFRLIQAAGPRNANESNTESQGVLSQASKIPTITAPATATTANDVAVMGNSSLSSYPPATAASLSTIIPAQTLPESSTSSASLPQQQSSNQLEPQLIMDSESESESELVQEPAPTPSPTFIRPKKIYVVMETITKRVYWMGRDTEEDQTSLASDYGYISLLDANIQAKYLMDDLKGEDDSEEEEDDDEDEYEKYPINHKFRSELFEEELDEEYEDEIASRAIHVKELNLTWPNLPIPPPPLLPPTISKKDKKRSSNEQISNQISHADKRRKVDDTGPRKIQTIHLTEA